MKDYYKNLHKNKYISVINQIDKYHCACRKKLKRFNKECKCDKCSRTYAFGCGKNICDECNYCDYCPVDHPDCLTSKRFGILGSLTSEELSNIINN